jgi:hypothetical protein
MIHELLLSPTETASGSHPCCVVSVTYHRPSYFHGGNTGSNPVGDAKSFQKFKSAGSFFRSHGADEVLRGRPRQIPWTINIRAPTFRNLLVAAIASDVGTFMSK